MRWSPSVCSLAILVSMGLLAGVGDAVAQIDRDALEADNTRRIPLPIRQVLSVGLLTRRRFGEIRSVTDLGSDDWIRRALIPGEQSPIGIRVVDSSTPDASAILGLDSGREDGAPTHVQPAKTEEFPTAARRPAYSALSCDRFEEVFGLQIPDWQAALALAMSGY